MMEALRKSVEDLVSDSKDYADLKIDELKLKTVEGLSISVSRILPVIIMVMMASMAVAVMTFGCVILIGYAVGSLWAGAFIMAGFFAVVLFVLYLFRDRLFLNMFVRLFINVLYGND